MELLGFTLYDYFSLINEPFKNSIQAKAMSSHIGQEVLLYGKLVNTRFHEASNENLMRFAPLSTEKVTILIRYIFMIQSTNTRFMELVCMNAMVR